MSHTIYETSNYSQFKRFPGNRTPDPRKVHKLQFSIEQSNLLHLNPIIVDSKYRVIDGGHRLEAAKNLGIPIHYIVENNLNHNDIILINTARTNWSIQDYIRYYTSEEFENFRTYKFLLEIEKIVVTNGLLPSVVISMLGSASNTPGRLYDAIKNGKFILSSEEMNKLKAFCLDTLPRIRSINLDFFQKPKNKNVFAGRAYLYTLVRCFDALDEKDYNDLWDSIRRDHQKFFTTASHTFVQQSFENSFNRQKKKWHLKFIEGQASLVQASFYRPNGNKKIRDEEDEE